MGAKDHHACLYRKDAPGNAWYVAIINRGACTARPMDELAALFPDRMFRDGDISVEVAAADLHDFKGLLARSAFGIDLGEGGLGGMYCPSCGTELPDDANFCLKCGHGLKEGTPKQQSRPMRWEYKDLSVPLGDIPYDAPYDMRPIITAALDEAGREGWTADGATEYSSLSREGRLTVKAAGFFSSAKYQYASIRVKRLIVE